MVGKERVTEPETCWLRYFDATSWPPLATQLCTLGFAMSGMMPVYASFLTTRFGQASLGQVMGVSNLFMLTFNLHP